MEASTLIPHLRLQEAALYDRWRQEAPLGCVEHDECEEEKRREREAKSPRIIDDEL